MRQQIGDFPAQPRVTATGLTQIRVALGGIALQRLVKDLLKLFPSFHDRISRRLSVPGAAKIAPSGVYTPEEAPKYLLNEPGRLHRMIFRLTAEVTARKQMQ